MCYYYFGSLATRKDVARLSSGLKHIVQLGFLCVGVFCVDLCLIYTIPAIPYVFWHELFYWVMVPVTLVIIVLLWVVNALFFDEVFAYSYPNLDRAIKEQDRARETCGRCDCDQGKSD